LGKAEGFRLSIIGLDRQRSGVSLARPLAFGIISGDWGGELLESSIDIFALRRNTIRKRVPILLRPLNNYIS
jgi:hypothetical protein